MTNHTKWRRVHGWSSIDSAATTGAACGVVASFVATADNHTSGVWANATDMIALVISGQDANNDIGGHAATVTRTSGTVSIAPAVTLAKDDGSSMLLHFYGHRGAPSWPVKDGSDGYTTQIQLGEVCCDTKDDTTSDGAIQHNCNASSAIAAVGITVEILAATNSGKFFAFF